MRLSTVGATGRNKEACCRVLCATARTNAQSLAS